jgi:hypothetical protein
VDHWQNYAPWLVPLESTLGQVLQRYPDVPGFESDVAVSD